MLRRAETTPAPALTSPRCSAPAELHLRAERKSPQTVGPAVTASAYLAWCHVRSGLRRSTGVSSASPSTPCSPMGQAGEVFALQTRDLSLRTDPPTATIRRGDRSLPGSPQRSPAGWRVRPLGGRPRPGLHLTTRCTRAAGSGGAGDGRADAAIVQACRPWRRQIDLLQTIPGVGEGVAQVLVAETGADMSRFPPPRPWPAGWAGAGDERIRRQTALPARAVRPATAMLTR